MTHVSRGESSVLFMKCGKISDMHLTSEQAEEHGPFGTSIEIHQDQVPRS